MRRVLALAIPLALLASPAHAERWSDDDPAGDVEGTRYDSEPTPCGTETVIDASDRDNEDIVALSARHSRSSLRLVLTFGDLDESMEQWVSFRIETPTRAWDLDVDRFTARKGRFRVLVTLSKAPRPPSEDEVDECGWWGYAVVERPCRLERSIDFAAETVTVTMPRSCVGSPDWVRVGANATGWGDYQARGSFTSYWDLWGTLPEAEPNW